MENCDSCGNCCVLEMIRTIFCGGLEKKAEDKGNLVLAAGHHEVKITTKHPNPCAVYISLKDIDHQVCGGDINMAGTKLLSDGFVLYADIKSNECKVKWAAKHHC